MAVPSYIFIRGAASAPRRCSCPDLREPRVLAVASRIRARVSDDYVQPRTVTRPTRHRRFPSIPRCAPSFPWKREEHYAGAVEGGDKCRQIILTYQAGSRGWPENKLKNALTQPLIYPRRRRGELTEQLCSDPQMTTLFYIIIDYFRETYSVGNLNKANMSSDQIEVDFPIVEHPAPLFIDDFSS
jgi:hypothetical protein